MLRKVVTAAAVGVGFFATQQYATNPKVRDAANQHVRDAAAWTGNEAVQHAAKTLTDKGDEKANVYFRQQPK